MYFLRLQSGGYYISAFPRAWIGERDHRTRMQKRRDTGHALTNPLYSFRQKIYRPTPVSSEEEMRIRSENPLLHALGLMLSEPMLHA